MCQGCDDIAEYQHTIDQYIQAQLIEMLKRDDAEENAKILAGGT